MSGDVTLLEHPSHSREASSINYVHIFGEMSDVSLICLVVCFPIFIGIGSEVIVLDEMNAVSY